MSQILYIIMGWGIVAAIKLLVKNMALPGVILIIAGGVCYTVGVIFYALGKKVAKKVGMQNIKLFASVKNLCVFTKYTGFDPEVNTRQGQTGDLMPSLDYSAYPRNRSYSVGFNFIF